MLFLSLSGVYSDSMIQGTPMFMANDVIHPRDEDRMSAISSRVKWSDVPYEGRWRMFPRIKKAAIIDSSKYGDDAERTAWNNFYERDIELLSWIVDPKGPQYPRDSFKHGAVHDAESVFLLCILFFDRLWPRGKMVTAEEKERLRADRGRSFKQLFKKQVGDEDAHAFLNYRDLPRDGFYSDKKTESLYDMLNSIKVYLNVPWYNVMEVGRGQRFEFHLHDYMQRLLLQEIQKLRESGDPIHLEVNPLPVVMDIQTSGNELQTSSIYVHSGIGVGICHLKAFLY